MDVASAARSNALWCDAVCRAHGRPGELAPGLWLSRHEVPRHYPNLVSLEPSPDRALEAIRALAGAGLPEGWGVKDSFRALALEPLGFRVLFEAEWLALRAPLRRRPAAPGTRFARVAADAELAAWEAAWGESDPGPRVFLPALLARGDVAFVAAWRGDRLAAGAIGMPAAGAVALSNLFGPRANDAALRAGCLALLADLFPGRPLLGYAAGADLAAAKALGFAPLGPLRVWVRRGASESSGA